MSFVDWQHLQKHFKEYKVEDFKDNLSLHKTAMVTE